MRGMWCSKSGGVSSAASADDSCVVRAFSSFLWAIIGLAGKKHLPLGHGDVGLHPRFLTSHSMDRKIQINAKEEPAEGQGTEKKNRIL